MILGAPLFIGFISAAEALRALRRVVQHVGRPMRVDVSGEIFHWIDGYHLSVQLYEKLLCSVFDILDEEKLLEVCY